VHFFKVAVSKGHDLWRGFGLAQNPNDDSRLTGKGSAARFFQSRLLCVVIKKRRLRCLGVGLVAGAPGGLFAGAGVFAMEDAGALE
jgi:hypothetical protein